MPKTTVQYHYASFTQRLWAIVIDYVIIVSIYSVILAFIPQKILLTLVAPLDSVITSTPSLLSPYFQMSAIRILRLYLVIQLLLAITNYAYAVYLVSHTGQTIGKKIMGIRVIDVATGKHPRSMQAYMRETIGKLISGILLGIGFFMMLQNKKKQTWHDQISNTAVIKV